MITGKLYNFVNDQACRNFATAWQDNQDFVDFLNGRSFRVTEFSRNYGENEIVTEIQTEDGEFYNKINIWENEFHMFHEIPVRCDASAETPVEDKCFIQVDGKIKIEVTDEASRLFAIEALQKVRF